MRPHATLRLSKFGWEEVDGVIEIRSSRREIKKPAARNRLFENILNKDLKGNVESYVGLYEVTKCRFRTRRSCRNRIAVAIKYLEGGECVIR